MIEWTPALETGHEMVDRDHRTLIGLVNQMNLPANRDDRAVLEFVLDELLDYTVARRGSRAGDVCRRLRRRPAGP